MTLCLPCTLRGLLAQCYTNTASCATVAVDLPPRSPAPLDEHRAPGPLANSCRPASEAPLLQASLGRHRCSQHLLDLLHLFGASGQSLTRPEPSKTWADTSANADRLPSPLVRMLRVLGRARGDAPFFCSFRAATAWFTGFASLASLWWHSNIQLYKKCEFRRDRGASTMISLRQPPSGVQMRFSVLAFVAALDPNIFVPRRSTALCRS